MVKKLQILFAFFLPTIFFIAVNQEVLIDDHKFLYGDNIRFLFPSFFYTANSLEHGFGLPHINFGWGGSLYSLSSISLLDFTPHKLAGYILYSLSEFPPLLVYKCSLILGLIFNAYGWYLCWHKLYKNLCTVIYSLSMYMFCGIGLTVFGHQEQVLSTIGYIPWIVLVFYNLNSYPSYMLFGALLGISLNQHYPFIQLLLIVVFILFHIGRFNYINFTTLKDNLGRLTLFCIIALLMLLPLLYIYILTNDYYSPWRQTNSISIDTLEQYLTINNYSLSSAPFNYFAPLFNPFDLQVGDPTLFFLPFPTIIFFLIGLCACIATRRYIIVAYTFFSLWAALGVFAFLPQILFLLKFPFVSSFRQWYHFAPVLMICIITISGFGFDLLVNKIRSSNKLYLFFLVSVACCFYYQIQLQTINYNKWTGQSYSIDNNTIKRLSFDEFIESLNTNPSLVNNIMFLNGQNGVENTPLFAHLNGLELYKNCAHLRATRIYHLPNNSKNEGIINLCEGKNEANTSFHNAYVTPSYLFVGPGAVSYYATIVTNLFESYSQISSGYNSQVTMIMGDNDSHKYEFKGVFFEILIFGQFSMLIIIIFIYLIHPKVRHLTNNFSRKVS